MNKLIILLIVLIPLALTQYVTESQYLGCYMDDHAGDIKAIMSTAATIDECQTKCSNYKYFAVRFFSSDFSLYNCRCGNAYATKPVYYKISDSRCKVSNNGKPLWYGSSSSNAVYIIFYDLDLFILDLQEFFL